MASPAGRYAPLTVAHAATPPASRSGPCPGPCGCSSGTATSVSGTVFGCGNTPIGSGISVVLTSGMTTLFSTTTSSLGTWSGTISISGTVSVTVTATPASSRQIVTAASYSVTAGTPHGGMNVTFAAASGYACYAGCVLPISQTIHYTGGTCGLVTWPNDTLTWQASPPSYALGAGITGAVWLGTDQSFTGPFGAGTYDYLIPANVAGKFLAFYNHTSSNTNTNVMTWTCGPPPVFVNTCGSFNAFQGTGTE